MNPFAFTGLGILYEGISCSIYLHEFPLDFEDFKTQTLKKEFIRELEAIDENGDLGEFIIRQVRNQKEVHGIGLALLGTDYLIDLASPGWMGSPYNLHKIWLYGSGSLAFLAGAIVDIKYLLNKIEDYKQND